MLPPVCYIPRERQQRPIRRRIQRVHIAAPASQLHRLLALHGRLYAASCGGTTFPVAQVDIQILFKTMRLSDDALYSIPSLSAFFNACPPWRIA